MSEATKPLTRTDIARRADTAADRMMLQDSAPYVAFRYALERGWITQAEHDAARVRSGRLWNYCGD
jgi:ribulose bisphosphate carboxylase small subunit